jgi:hypothetical protein
MTDEIPVFCTGEEPQKSIRTDTPIAEQVREALATFDLKYVGQRFSVLYRTNGDVIYWLRSLLAERDELMVAKYPGCKVLSMGDDCPCKICRLEAERDTLRARLTPLTPAEPEAR